MTHSIPDLIKETESYLKTHVAPKTFGYQVESSYEENYRRGPVLPESPWELVRKIDQTLIEQGKWNVMGQKIATPFGSPAGPLLNGRKFIVGQGSEKPGYSDFFGNAVFVRKTVRSVPWSVHPNPNVAFLSDTQSIQANEVGSKRQAELNYHPNQGIAITNSFGVPSEDPKVDGELPNWFDDVRDTKEQLKTKAPHAYLVLSGQGTGTPDRTMEQDYAEIAALMLEAYGEGRGHIELNFSCPNTKEGDKAGMVYCDPRGQAEEIVKLVRKRIGDKPKLVIKVGYFPNQSLLKDFIEAVGPMINGISSINTVSMEVVGSNEEEVLPGRKTSGICGQSIFELSYQQAQQLAEERERLGLNDLALILGGGVMNVEDYQRYAKIALPTGGYVFSATGVWVDPYLPVKVKLQQLKELS